MKNRGFVHIILLIIIAVIVLGYLGVNLKDVLASPTVQDNLTYTWGLASKIWDDYLREPALWVHQHIIKLMWDLFKNGLEGLKNGEGPSSLIPEPKPVAE